MNRIVDFSEDLAYVTVEPASPSASFSNFWASEIQSVMDATGASPECSIVGNTMERGFGHTPYGTISLPVAA